MARPNFDTIEIVEPPIEELSKGHSHLKRTCLAGCGGIVIFIIALGLGLWIALGPGPKTLTTVPANFPTDIPLYDKDAIESIAFIPGTYKKRGTTIAAFFPKIILSPLLLDSHAEITSRLESDSKLFSYAENIKKIWRLIKEPVDADSRDTIQIKWGKMDAEPSFVIGYYKKELSKKKYNTNTVNNSDTFKELHFDNDRGVSGTLTASGDEASRPGTDSAFLIVNLPKQN
ncbi:MAG: hypothetical protein EXS55_04295 [Candidatus Magasanikbacteria bacterium]|nr:hypothetical protein [Candidatus Magasanikbacteria bacterium]